MNTDNMTQTIKDFWDGAFKDLKPMKLNQSDFNTDDDLSQALKFLGDNAEKVLEIGVGTGHGILTCRATGKRVKHLIGFDPSANSIRFLQETCKLSNITNVELFQDDHSFLESLSDHSFDGVISSNVLDVLEEDISNFVIKEVKRILKPGGYFVVKINFYLTEEIIERTKAVEVRPNVYTINGVLRSVNRTTEEWISVFDGFNVIKQGTFERIKNGPLDRVLVLQKCTD